MPHTEEELELLFTARVLGTGRGMVLEPDAYPPAHRLAKQGWLEWRFEPDGAMSWWLSEPGDQLLDVAAADTARLN